MPIALAALRKQNACLIALLEFHGIDWHLPPEPTIPISDTESSNLSPQDKVALFRRLFRGRTDVYPVRWESTVGRSGRGTAESLQTWWVFFVKAADRLCAEREAVSGCTKVTPALNCL